MNGTENGKGSDRPGLPFLLTGQLAGKDRNGYRISHKEWSKQRDHDKVMCKSSDLPVLSLDFYVFLALLCWAKSASLNAPTAFCTPLKVESQGSWSWSSVLRSHVVLLLLLVVMPAPSSVVNALTDDVVEGVHGAQSPRRAHCVDDSLGELSKEQETFL